MRQAICCLSLVVPALSTGRGSQVRRAVPFDRLGAICLALPAATEKEAWGDPTFRVCNKIFAMYKIGDERKSFWCKAPPGSQIILVGADPETFFIPPYVGHKGWVGMRLDGAFDWREVEEVVRRSYCLVAPKQLAGTVPLVAPAGSPSRNRSPNVNVRRSPRKPSRAPSQTSQRTNGALAPGVRRPPSVR